MPWVAFLKFWSIGPFWVGLGKPLTELGLSTASLAAAEKAAQVAASLDRRMHERQVMSMIKTVLLQGHSLAIAG
jgi:hypothetical protein